MRRVNTWKTNRFIVLLNGSKLANYESDEVLLNGSKLANYEWDEVLLNESKLAIYERYEHLKTKFEVLFNGSKLPK